MMPSVRTVVLTRQCGSSSTVAAGCLGSRRGRIVGSEIALSSAAGAGGIVTPSKVLHSNTRTDVH